MIQPIDAQQLLGVAIATGVGLAIGLERGWQEIATRAHSAAGIRTFTLVGLLGGVCGWLQSIQGVDLVLLGLLAITLLTSIAYYLQYQRSEELGLTTEIALIITYVLGVVAGVGYGAAAIGVAVVVALILGLKTEIHRVVRHLDRVELLATLQLLVLAVLVVPNLPNHDVFSVQGSNPRVVGILTLLISFISYLGYFSVQLIGHHRGLLLTALLGGLASSTAVVVGFSRLARGNPQLRQQLGAGAALACAVMALRLLLLVGIIAPALAVSLVWSLLPLLLLPIITYLWSFKLWQAPTNEKAFELNNPLSLGTALVFGLLLLAISVSLPLISERLGELGVYALATLSGLTKVDALAMGVARNGEALGIASREAVIAITIAAIVSTLFKSAIALIVSKGALRFTSLALVLSAIVSGAILFATTR